MQFIIFRKVLFLFSILSFFLLGSSCDFLSKKKGANVIDTNKPVTSTTDEESTTSVIEEYPTDFPEQGNKMEDFVPKHWSAIMKGEFVFQKAFLMRITTLFSYLRRN